MYTDDQKKRVEKYLDEHNEALDIDKLMSNFTFISVEVLFEIIDALIDEQKVEVEEPVG